jgi:DNA ligase (NAD+)
MNNEEKIKRIKELTDLLNLASRTYYQEGREIMPNIDYDRYYDELLELEKETGFRLSNSPSQNVGYEIISELPKERHESPMLSLDKTKSADELISWMNGHKCVLSWKLDGITCVVTYEDGVLKKAVTRGNGEVGEVVTPNARYFENLPGQIPFKGKLVVRGEAVISYSDFERINEEVADTAARYKNPRNLCSGSVRQLDPSVTAGRHVKLIVFTLVSVEGTERAPEVPDLNNSFSAGFDWLTAQGFEVVEHVFTDGDTIKEDIQSFKDRIPTYDIPSDGLVLAFEDVAYGLSLGRTAKFPRNSIAFKWQDELAETTLRRIDWSGSRTGLINPVAVFDPVELEGTTVTRASVHNVSIVEELQLGIGDTINVYKSNMIIPQINDNLTRSGNVVIPDKCPVCGGPTEVRRDNTAALLYCINPDCPAKKIKSFALMVSRDALNVDGLSEMTLEKLIDNGFIHEYADIFKLERYRGEIAAMDGFGEKSAANLIASAKKASDTELYRFIYGLGIPGIGLAGAKAVCRAFGNDLERIMKADRDSLLEIRDIGPVLADNFISYFADDKNIRRALDLAEVLTFKKAEDEGDTEQIFEGMTFVITGDVRHFPNRKAVEAVIEKLGGKASGSVSSKTSYLINNDITSRSSKNVKAAELGIPVITEADFIAMLPEELKPEDVRSEG